MWCSGTATASAPERAGNTPPRVTVRLLLLGSPSAVQTTADLASVGVPVTALDQLIVGGSIYLEAWCQAHGTNGITTAAVDLEYDPTSLDTTPALVSLAAQWNLLGFDVAVDGATGRVNDLGGNNLNGLGVAPTWAKIGTVGFHVAHVPIDGFQFCSEPAGGPLVFAIRSEGSVNTKEVDFGCVSLTCKADAECDDALFCTGPERCGGDRCLSDGDPCSAENLACDEASRECVCATLANPVGFQSFPHCLSGPGPKISKSCDCASLDHDGDVDLGDFSILQRVFMAQP